MRALFSFDEALSPGVLTILYQIVSSFIALFALLGALAVLTTINTGNFFTALLTAFGMIGGGVAAILLLRLVGEIWMTQLRIQDRLGLILEQQKQLKP
ncbi:MAG: DUF4282 domain-containing protein [Alphaproteobacteria bacterium]